LIETRKKSAHYSPDGKEREEESIMLRKEKDLKTLQPTKEKVYLYDY